MLATRSTKQFLLSSVIISSDVSNNAVAQWVARLTRNVEVVGSNPIKGLRCFLEQETLPLLLSTGMFQERCDVTVELK